MTENMRARVESAVKESNGALTIEFAKCHPANYVMPLLSNYSEAFLSPDSMTGILRHPCSA